MNGSLCGPVRLRTLSAIRPSDSSIRYLTILARVSDRPRIEGDRPRDRVPTDVSFVARHNAGVLATLKRDGRPQMSNPFYVWDCEQQLAPFQVAAAHAKTHNLRADARATLHVTSPDFWTWVAVEGIAELSPIAAEPHDATVEELVTYYRALRGEHDDWGAYRAAMVSHRRLVVRLRPDHTYGQLRG